jgi:antitoxin ParD1/3/4
LDEDMNIALSKELEQLIQDKVKSGRYLSASEVVGEALRLLDERDSLRDSSASRVQEARLAELKVKIREGIEASERGEVVDGEEFFAELEEDIRHTAEDANHRQGKGWPPGFFEETFGAFKDDPLVIDSEGIFEDEEEFN